jgi:anti-anti-sigma factor
MPDAAVVEVQGPLDLAAAPAVCRAIGVATGAEIVVDLSGVTSCDVGGIRSLVEAAREARARSQRLVAVVEPGSAVDRLFTRTGSREFLAVASG